MGLEPDRAGSMRRDGCAGHEAGKDLREEGAFELGFADRIGVGAPHLVMVQEVP